MTDLPSRHTPAMTTDYRALCAELLTALEIQLDELRFSNRLCIRARATLAAEPEPAPPVHGENIGLEWQPCVKLPITVHVRAQYPNRTHVSTREGITPVGPDDLVMRGVQGEEYPIGREVFNKTYRLGSADPEPPADGAVANNRSCTCHPDDNPPRPCPKRYALDECRESADREVARMVAWLRKQDGGIARTAAYSRAADLLERLAPQWAPEGPSDEELLRCAKIGTPCYNTKAWDRELQMMRAAIALDRARWGRA